MRGWAQSIIPVVCIASAIHAVNFWRHFPSCLLPLIPYIEAYPIKQYGGQGNEKEIRESDVLTSRCALKCSHFRLDFGRVSGTISTDGCISLFVMVQKTVSIFVALVHTTSFKQASSKLGSLPLLSDNLTPKYCT